MEFEDKKGNADNVVPRAEEIIAEVYRQILKGRESGESVSRLVINRSLWSIIDNYRRKMGVLEGSLPDYLSEESLFGLEIWYGDGPDIRVE